MPCRSGTIKARRVVPVIIDMTRTLREKRDEVGTSGRLDTWKENERINIRPRVRRHIGITEHVKAS